MLKLKDRILHSLETEAMRAKAIPGVEHLYRPPDYVAAEIFHAAKNGAGALIRQKYNVTLGERDSKPEEGHFGRRVITMCAA
jgi:hypothetical protein